MPAFSPMGESLIALVNEAHKAIEGWRPAQEVATKRFSSIVNMVERIPLLNDDNHLGVLATLPSVPQSLIDKHLVACEESLISMKSCMGTMSGISDELDSILPRAIEKCAWKPEMTEKLDWLESIARMMRQEIATKREILSLIDFKAKSSQLEKYLARWSSETAIDWTYIDDIWTQIAT